MFNRPNILRILLMTCCMLLFMACQSVVDSQVEETATLQITFKSADHTLLTRGLEDLNDDGTVSEEEKFVDGSRMYRLAVFLVANNRVAASAILESDDTRFRNNNTEASISFFNLDYSTTYQLYAVANYGNYGTLTGNLASVTENNITSSLSVTASSDNICSLNTPYPLSLKREVKLTPGINTMGGELLRTYARIRINVRNQSAANDLYITKLNLASKFSQSSAHLFTEGGTANVTPVVTSDGAITPFVQDKKIDKLGANGEVSEATIFDSYLLESNGGNYNYTLGLKYQGESGGSDIYTVTNTVAQTPSQIENGALYLIYNVYEKKYLYANGNTHVGASNSYLTNGELNPNYVWRFDRTTTNFNFTIESMGASGYFMQSTKVSNSKVPLVVQPATSDYFYASTATSGNNNNIRFQSSAKGNNQSYNYYLSVNSNSQVVGHSSSSNQIQRNFHLYKVDKQQTASSVTHEETIPINIVNKTTGIASPLTAIHRNDFIDILVSVNYNEKTGDINFEVSNWTEVNGDVTFD